MTTSVHNICLICALLDRGQIIICCDDVVIVIQAPGGGLDRVGHRSLA